MTRTNIKNLPEGEYFTEYGYSQSYPWRVVSRTAKTVKLARVCVKPDPEWKDKMIWHTGGFAGHCANQSDQTWLFDHVAEEHVITVRLVKSRYAGETHMWGYKGRKFEEGVAREFYDYNF